MNESYRRPRLPSRTASSNHRRSFLLRPDGCVGSTDGCDGGNMSGADGCGGGGLSSADGCGGLAGDGDGRTRGLAGDADGWWRSSRRRTLEGGVMSLRATQVTDGSSNRK